MDFYTLFSKMIVLFAFIGVGLLCQKLGFLDDHTVKKLNKLVIYIFSPCLILKSVFGSSFSYAIRDILSLILFGAVYNAILFVFSFFLTKFLRPVEEDRKTYTFLMAYNNCIFMGFPVVSALFGDSAVFLASVCVIPYNLYLFTFGPIFLTGGKGNVRQLIFKSLLNPSFFATVIAMILFFMQLNVPQSIEDIVSYLANIVTPLSMMLIGVTLGSVSGREIFADLRIYIASSLRLIVLPILVFFTMRLIIKDELILNLITVLSVMPTAAVSPIFCAEYGGNTVLASKGVFITTLLALATVPILLSFLLI